MSRERVNIIISRDYLDRFPEVVQRLEAAGLTVEQRLELIGGVSGSIDAAKRGALDGIAGVAAVENERVIQLPPEDEPQ